MSSSTSSSSDTTKLACLSRVKNRNRTPSRLVWGNNIDIVFCYDKSASMNSEEMRDAAPNGLNDFIRDQNKDFRANADKVGRFRLVTFNNVASVVPGFDCVDIRKMDNVPREYLEPSLTTRLFDTVIEELELQRKRCKRYSDETHKINHVTWKKILVVVTDGQDNQSTVGREVFKKKITAARNEGVECIFIAANQDAVLNGVDYGFSSDNSLTYCGAGAGACMRALSGNISGGTPGFTQLQRESSCPTATQIVQDTQDYISDCDDNSNDDRGGDFSLGDSDFDISGGGVGVAFTPPPPPLKPALAGEVPYASGVHLPPPAFSPPIMHMNSKFNNRDIVNAVIAKDKFRAYELAAASGVRSTSDTLEGRILQGNWGMAESLAFERKHMFNSNSSSFEMMSKGLCQPKLVRHHAVNNKINCNKQFME